MTEPLKTTRIALGTLGCKLNQAETELMARRFVAAGYRLVPASQVADVYILNSCTVTHVADGKCRHFLRQAHRRNPDARLIVSGCYAERDTAELSRLEGVDLVLGNDKKADLLQLLEESGHLVPPVCVAGDLASAAYNGLRSRTFIAVQDGCDNFCAYCIVPLVRPRKVSQPADEVVTQVRQRVAEGYREAVLTGTEIGDYSRGGLRLDGLLRRILSGTDVMRLRLSSLQPQELTPELLSLWSDTRLCRHFHLSLQSGSDGVLKRMKRRYSAADFKEAVSLIRSAVPEAAITTDVIVGFPGETEAEFAESYQFCRQIGFARIHVFAYSPRPGTAAAAMPGQVGAKVKKSRSQKMLALAEESARNFHKRFLGEVMPVLWEQKSNGVWSGLTDNYIRVYTRSNEDLTNKLQPVKLERLYKDGVVV